jgi:hypothetical protein
VTLLPIPFPDGESISDAVLGNILYRLRPTESALIRGKVHALNHALRFWGASARFDQPQCRNGAELLSIILDDREYRRRFPGAGPLLFDSDYGVAVWVADDLAAAPHTDKCLSVCAEIGIPLDRPVYTRRRTATVAALLSDSIARFQIDQKEVEWSAIAYSLYLPPQRKWVNHFQREFAFDDLAERLLKKEDGEGPCFGTHPLYALCHLLRVDDEHEILSPPLRDRIRGRLRAVSEKLAANQSRDGAWGSQWHLPPTGKPQVVDKSPRAVQNALRVTGHHAEWLALAPQDTRPAAASLRAAMRYLTETLRTLPDQDFVEAYSPLSHAARALCLLSGIRPDERENGHPGP